MIACKLCGSVDRRGKSGVPDFGFTVTGLGGGPGDPAPATRRRPAATRSSRAAIGIATEKHVAPSGSGCRVTVADRAADARRTPSIH